VTRSGETGVPLRADDTGTIEDLRAALDRGGYTAAVLTELLGGGKPFARDLAEIPYHRRLLPEGTPLKTIVELFLFGLPVAEDEAAAALEPLTPERLEALGLVVRADTQVESLVDLVPFGEFFLASDRYEGENPPTRLEHVAGVTPPARVLADLVARREARSALDLGTGCGIQAVLLARHAERIVATDLNPRAVAYAEFNAALNGLGQIEARHGDLFEPVEGERFDLIVCNPPFVISPEESSGYLFRDSGMRGDRFCEALVRRLPEFLQEGGHAHVLVSWTHGEGEDWSAPLRDWVAGSGCDALLVHLNSYTPLKHAAEWIRGLRWDADAYAEGLDRWLEYYRANGIEAVAWGAIVLRKRSGADNWVWAESPPTDDMGAAGHHVLRVCANQDLLAAIDGPGELLERVFVLAEDHRLDRFFHFEDGSGVIDRAQLRLDGGFAFELGVDLETVGVLAQLDGRRTLREALVAGGIAPDDVESATGGLRRLLELGFVVAP
jgi:SAM-dependent methyltransferase